MPQRGYATAPSFPSLESEAGTLRWGDILSWQGTFGPRTTCPGGQLVLGPHVRGDSWSGGQLVRGTRGPPTTSQIICDITTTLLKYGKYIEKLKLTAQAVYMQITMIFTMYMCKQDDRRALLCNLKIFKSFALFLCFPLRQLPTLSTLTKWELTKWELTKWEVDQMGIDKVGIDKVGIDEVGINLL